MAVEVSEVSCSAICYVRARACVAVGDSGMIFDVADVVSGYSTSLHSTPPLAALCSRVWSILTAHTIDLSTLGRVGIRLRPRVYSLVSELMLWMLECDALRPSVYLLEQRASDSAGCYIVR